MISLIFNSTEDCLSFCYNEKIIAQKKLLFNAKELPTITIKNYLYRIQTYSEAEDNTLIFALILIDKICETGSIILTEYNIHRLLFISILISIKYNEDLVFELDCYSKIAGITKKEIKKLEYEFLTLIKFEVYVQKTLFDNYKNYIYNINSLKDNIDDEDIF